jgi:dTMP kinase
METIVDPALKEGKTVISDRTWYSTVAYGEALGVDPVWLTAANSHFRKPDAVLFLLPSLDVCMERLGRRDESDAFENRLLQEKVHAAYHRMAQEDPSIPVIDTNGEKAAISGIIWEKVRGIL